MKKAMLASVCIVLSVQISVFAATVNLVDDPGFETRTGSWELVSGNVAWPGGDPDGVGDTYLASLYNKGNMINKEALLVRPSANYTYSVVSRSGAAQYGVKGGVQLWDPKSSTRAAGVILPATDAWTTTTGTLNPGNVDQVQFGVYNIYYDTVLFDNAYLYGDDSYYVKGAYNGTMAGTEGWLRSGGTGASSSISHTDDGTGSLLIYASSYGNRASSITQWMLVDQDVDYTINYSSYATGNNRAFGYILTDIDGNILLDVAHVVQGTGWTDRSISFNSGSNDVVFLSFTSYTTDYVVFDDVSLVPEPATIGLLAVGLVGLLRSPKKNK